MNYECGDFRLAHFINYYPTQTFTDRLDKGASSKCNVALRKEIRQNDQPVARPQLSKTYQQIENRTHQL